MRRMPPLPPFPLGNLTSEGMPRYSKTDEEMRAIAKERTTARLNALYHVIRASMFHGALDNPQIATTLLTVASEYFDDELGRVRIEYFIGYEGEPPPDSSPLRSID